MKKYEYKVEPLKKGTFASAEKYAEQIAAKLNTLGADGWELIEITGNTFLDGYVIQVFKREVSK